MMSKLSIYLKNLLKLLFQGPNDYKKQSFTFFIPAPPPRSTGYREKQFDSLFYEFINRGYDILEFKCTTVNTGESSSGMWIICLVQAKNSEAEALMLDEDFVRDLKGKIQTKDQIEGLYYIDDRANEIIK